VLKIIYDERAKLRQLATLKQNAGNTDMLKSAERNDSGAVRDIMSKKTGVKRDKLVKIRILGEKAESGDEVAKQVLKKADSGEITINTAVNTLKLNDIAKSEAPEAEIAKVLVDEVGRGKITPTKAFQHLKSEQNSHKEKAEVQAAKTAKIPQGIFNVILANPPYPFEEIMHKRIPNDDDDSVLFLWSTAHLLPESLELMEFWGFEYKSMAVLDKGIKGFSSWFLASSYDILLLGVNTVLH